MKFIWLYVFSDLRSEFLVGSIEYIYCIYVYLIWKFIYFYKCCCILLVNIVIFIVYVRIKLIYL